MKKIKYARISLAGTLIMLPKSVSIANFYRMMTADISHLRRKTKRHSPLSEEEEDDVAMVVSLMRLYPEMRFDYENRFPLTIGSRRTQLPTA